MLERVSNHRQRLHSRLLPDLCLDFRRSTARSQMAHHPLLQHDRHHCLHFARRDTSDGSILAPGTTVHSLLDRRKHGAFDDGMDG